MELSLPTVLATLDVLVAATAIGFALVRTRGFGSTIAWVLVIVAFPLLGALAYFLVANPRVGRTRKRFRASLRRARTSSCASRGGLARLDGLAPVFQLARRVTGVAPTGGNEAVLLTRNGEAFARMESAIRAARTFVWTEYYIIAGDETGRRFLDLLADRATEGLDVRLLYDAVGSANIDRKGLAALVAAGGKVEAFLPVNPLRRRWAVHLRNHRKILVVDGDVGFTGGMNVADEYSGEGHGKPWRDTHLELRGPAVQDLAAIFLEDWCFATEEVLELPPCGAPVAASPTESEALPGVGPGTLVALLASGPEQRHNVTALAWFTGIATARKRCWITSPYFIPDDAMIRALASAALRGVDVRVLVPRVNDVALLGPAVRSYYPTLVQAGIQVFEYTPSMLHAKTLVVDGEWALIGSANLDMRSFRLNFEASALLWDPAFAGAMEARFLEDQGQSLPVTSSALAIRSVPARLLEGAAQMLSPLL